LNRSLILKLIIKQKKKVSSSSKLFRRKNSQKIRKVLLTEAGPDSASDRESDAEVITSESFKGSMKEGEGIGEYGQRQDRIFKYITI